MDLNTLENLLKDLKSLYLSQSKLAEVENVIARNSFDCASLSAKIAKLEDNFSNFSIPEVPKQNLFVFYLERDANGYADDSWEEIIEKGQELQKPYFEKAEHEWTEKQGPPPANAEGWYGTQESPKIQIVCNEPVYWFKNTARLPGRFEVICPTHRGTVLRFEGTGDRVLKDNNAWGYQTNAPVGLYVEPTTRLKNGIVMRNFEHTIRGVIIVAHNGSMPIYLAQNPFNLLIADNNIQAHQGAKISIKHGPALLADWYPVEQIYPPNYQSIYLPDPVFSNMLIEGPHKFQRKSCAILASGNNMIFDRLNFYGHMCGLLLHGGQGRIVSNCSCHHGATGDGRYWVDKSEIVLAHLIYDLGKNKDGIAGNCEEFPIHRIKRGMPVPKGGWFNGGETHL